MKYGNLVAPIISAINELAQKQSEQDAQIAAQNATIQSLIKRIDEQDRLIESLKASR